jgi:hypothetical protein
MLLTLTQGQEAKAVLGVGGKGVRLIVQLIKQGYSPSDDSKEDAPSPSLVAGETMATVDETRTGSNSPVECEAKTCKLQQLAVLVMWGFCAGGSHCRQLALGAGLMSALIQCMRIAIPAQQGNGKKSIGDDTGPLALRYEAARL